MKSTKWIWITLCLFLCLPLHASAQTEKSYSPEKLSLLLKKYQEAYPGPIVFPHAPQQEVNISPLPTNSDQALLYPNQNEPSNQQTHAQTLNSNSIDNETLTLSNPNQDQPSNQDMLRSRLNVTKQ